MNRSSLALWPAIDLRGGRVVRLLRGELARETVYEADPAETARRFSEEGADGIHVVDLDAAFGQGENRAAVRAVVRAAGIPVEVGGGLRTRADVLDSLTAGAHRVVLGSLPFTAPALFAALLAELGERLVVALDCRDGRPTIRGWTEDAGAGGVAEVAARLGGEGLDSLLVTDVARDGAMTGPNLDLLVQVRGAFGGEVLASGGVRGEEDLKPVADALAPGRAGVILGRALHEGRTSVRELAGSLGRAQAGLRGAP